MAGLIEYLNRIEYTWRYRWVDLWHLRFVSLLTCMTRAFCLMIRNTLIMHCKEFKKFYWICGYAPLNQIYKFHIFIKFCHSHTQKTSKIKNFTELCFILSSKWRSHTHMHVLAHLLLWRHHLSLWCHKLWTAQRKSYLPVVANLTLNAAKTG
jgi:hypothetical protein